MGDYAGHICCGRAGQAYATLSLFRSTGADVHLSRARELLARATVEIEHRSMRPDSLIKGDAGVALVKIELREPLLSAMPLFEPDAWPAQPTSHVHTQMSAGDGDRCVTFRSG